MNFKETLAEKTVHAEDVLTKYLPEEKGYQKKVIESMNYSVLAGGKRLRPILMTTLTTVLGMVPMAVGTGIGSEMWNSLGMSVAWGLSFSTLITLILIPTLYTTFAVFGENRRKRKELKLQQ